MLGIFASISKSYLAQQDGMKVESLAVRGGILKSLSRQSLLRQVCHL
jgi:hypothetical protein